MDTHEVVNELQLLKDKVSALFEKHPKSSIGYKEVMEIAEMQIPLVCQTLNDASNALTKSRDPYGNPITIAQVESSLKQLVAKCAIPVLVQ